MLTKDILEKIQNKGNRMSKEQHTVTTDFLTGHKQALTSVASKAGSKSPHWANAGITSQVEDDLSRTLERAIERFDLLNGRPGNDGALDAALDALKRAQARFNTCMQGGTPEARTDSAASSASPAA